VVVFKNKTKLIFDNFTCQRHAPAALYPRGKDPGTHCTGGWVGPRAGLDTEVRGKIIFPLSGIEPRSPGRPVRSPSVLLILISRICGGGRREQQCREIKLIQQ
jgi:hypothetical protein